jgi:hypothetical protein
VPEPTREDRSLGLPKAKVPRLSSKAVVVNQSTRSATRRQGVSLKRLVDEGLLAPGKGVFRCEYKGMVSLGDLAEDGQILWEGLSFESPSAWSIYLKRLVTPNRKADDGWKTIKYEGKFLEHFKQALAEKLLRSSDISLVKGPPSGSIFAAAESAVNNALGVGVSKESTDAICGMKEKQFTSSLCSCSSRTEDAGGGRGLAFLGGGGSASHSENACSLNATDCRALKMDEDGLISIVPHQDDASQGVFFNSSSSAAVVQQGEINNVFFSRGTYNAFLSSGNSAANVVRYNAKQGGFCSSSSAIIVTAQRGGDRVLMGTGGSSLQQLGNGCFVNGGLGVGAKLECKE